MTCRWWFSPSACFLLARNKFPFSLTRSILFKLDWGDWMPNRKWPSKMQINLWGNLFVHLPYVSILNLWLCVYHKYGLAPSFSLLSQWYHLNRHREMYFLCVHLNRTTSSKTWLLVKCVFIIWNIQNLPGLDTLNLSTCGFTYELITHRTKLHHLSQYIFKSPSDKLGLVETK